LVLDVKLGRGAFMKDLESARQLARGLVRVSKQAGTKAVALLTDMSSPIGTSIGNANETREAIAVLQGGGPADTRELTLELGAEMLLLGGVARQRRVARSQLERVLADGSALEVFRRLVEAHGGDPRVADDLSRLPVAKRRVAVVSNRSGVVRRIDAFELGLTAVAMGAGRTRADQHVDHGIGIELAAKPGERVASGQPLAWLLVHNANAGRPYVERVSDAFDIGPRRPQLGPLVIDRITR
jgi:pyrimidine-nucleoside phosphorylase